ncbi:PH and Sec7 domain containing protein [Ceratobasidium theobromae]|uniref:PH and Sec7 domain containing protein n=1 Tax=Ceratobasidium theobromae TaxID=1582974 RepID=A0A5N5QTP9_9AGAM|nr:PH and Sec7 domain containing protein [Ceratobasidium theobromae]
MPLWNPKFKTQLNSSFSKSSVNVAATSEGRGSPVYHDARAQGTSSELNLDQQTKLQRIKSKPSQLNRGTKSSSNASVESFHTAGAGSHTSEQANIEDASQVVPERDDTAKSFAERAWQEDSTFVEREKLVEWLGSPSEIRRQALTYYIAHFDFGNMEIDEAIRLLCNKLYIKGETQQIDRVLEAFSEHYVSQNPNSMWKLADIVHVVSFAIILLNTDLQASELHAHITSPRFVENTIEAVRTQLQQDTMTLNSPTSNDAPTLDPLPDIDELPLPHSPTTPPISRASSPPNVDRRSFTTRNRLSSIGSIPLVNRDSWVVALHPSEAGDHPLESNILEERWINDISRELTAIYNRIRARPILQTRQEETVTATQTKASGLLKRGSAKLYHSLRGESPYAQSSPSASGASFVSVFGHRVSSSMSSLPHFLGLTSNQSLPSNHADSSKSIDSPLAKSGQLLWKSMKPTPGRIAKPKRWLSVIATVRSSNFDMNGPTPPGNNPGAGRRLGTLSLLHSLALEVPAPKGSKVRSFGLSLASGETHVFEIQPASSSSNPFKSKPKSGPDADAEVSAWVRACNYHAARYSRAPLPDAVTNVEYGWNGAAVSEDDQSSISGRTRNALIDDWVAPNLPMFEAQTDAGTQLEVWVKQVEMCNAEFAEHGELRGRMMNLYRPGSAQAQKALSNWEKKAQYLLTEIVKYETYAEILKSAELAPQAST